MAEFVHLHVHSEYSLLDGLAKVDRLFARAQELGMKSLALTDHGVMYGVIDFYKAGQKFGIKPILGCELYVARQGVEQRDPGKGARSHHLTVLAQNETGYRNLLKLVSRAQLEGFYYKPRVDKTWLAEYSDGLIVLSGCSSAEIVRALRDGQVAHAREAITWFKEHFPGRFYLELQEHDLPELTAVNRQLVALGRELGLPLVATNDVHYPRAEDTSAHDILLCIQTNTTINDPKRMRYGPTFYMKSADEMAALFPELPEALTNSLAIAEQCNVQIEFGRYHLPPFDVPPDYTAESYLRQLCETGLAQHYHPVTDRVRQQLDYELSVIHQMGFDTYFLIVWDLCRFARQQDIWYNVRGSAAGSIVAYCLGITNLDPLAHGLIFERFLNPGRISMPDIDLDFPDDRRDEMIQYAFEKYGRDRVAQIITFGTMGARAAIRDAGRALDMPLGEVDRVARLVPAVPGMPKTIDDALNEVSELKELYASTDYIRSLVDTARSLEGLARHASTHAAGVVISDEPLVDYCPLHRPTKGNESGYPVTQFEMGAVEALGLLKVDFLGLSTLSIMRRACEFIERHHGVRLDLDNIPTDAPKIYELLSSGEVTGIFQVEGQGMRRVLVNMQPSSFDDVVAAISLFRPGPMEYIDTYIARKHGREKIEYRHPKLEPILRDTYGIVIYQEQIIQLASELAGYAPGDADTIRKAVGKKIKEQLVKHREKFVAGAAERGIPEEVAHGIFDDIEYFARYGFNKAHAADYARVTCQTAYLKAYYPIEYMTAMLSVERSDTAKVGMLIGDCQRLGIQVLPPDVNRSDLDFVAAMTTDVTDHSSLVVGRSSLGAIRYGLAAIKNVGEGPVKTILEARGDEPFANLDDFCHRVDLRQVNRRGLECLIKAGALDGFGRRGQLLEVVDQMLAISQQSHQAQDVGQMSLFDVGGPGFGGNGLHQTFQRLPDVPDVAHKELLAWEKELLGTYMSEHPLHRLADQVQDTITALCGQIDGSMAGQKVIVAGMVSGVRTITTRKGEPMAFVQLEDLQGGIEVTIFPRVYAQTHELWTEDNLVLLTGKVDDRGGRVSIIAESATEYVAEEQPTNDERRTTNDEQPATSNQQPATTNGELPSSFVLGPSSPSHHLLITVPRSTDHEQDIVRLGQLYDLLTSYQGADRFSLFVNQGARRVQIDFPNTTTRYCVGLLNRLEEMLGPDAVRVTSLQ